MRLKESPEDFVVDEIPTERFEESIVSSLSDRYLVLRARKRDCAHFDLMRAITNRFSIPESELGIGGIKDRRAVTSQLITLPNLDRIRDPFSKNTVLELSPGTGEATLELLGSSERRMTIGSLFGNRFSIRAILSDEQRAGLTHLPALMRVPNYFGSQRFGRNRENVMLGYALLTGNFRLVRDTLLSSSDDDPAAFVKRISRKKRMLLISAFQSALFNAEIIDLIVGGVLDRIGGSDDRIEELTRIADERVYASTYGFYGPMPIVSLGSECTDFQEALLELLDLSPRSFAIRQLPDIMFEPVVRSSIIEVAFDSFELAEDLRVTFSLPRGSYATVVFESMSSIASRISAKTSSGD